MALKLLLGRLKGYATVRVHPPTLGWLLGSSALVVPLKHRQLSTPLRSSFSLFAGRGRDRRAETDDRAVSAPEIIAFDPVFFFFFIKYNTRERWRDTFLAEMMRCLSNFSLSSYYYPVCIRTLSKRNLAVPATDTIDNAFSLQREG